MNYKVYMSKVAKNDIVNIYNYIKINLMSPDAAINIVRKIESSIEDLNFMPERYERVGLEGLEYENIRRLMVNNYIVIYKVIKEEYRVEVLRVFYSKRDIISY